jgi:predicted RNase H-like HicB family nuclease
MRTVSAVDERCPSAAQLVGSVPGFPGAHSQAATFEELQSNRHEVVEMLLEDGEPKLESDFVGLQQICIAS